MIDGQMALIVTFSEPPPQITDEAFMNMYDKEHMPLYLALPGVRSGTRLSQSADTELDAKKPRFATLYDITDVGFHDSEEYRNLEFSPNESELLRLIAEHGYINLRTYRALERPGGAAYVVHEEFGKSKKTLEGGLMELVSMSHPEADLEDFHRFYDDEHIPALRKVPGWLRSRRYILHSHTEIGPLKETIGNPEPPRFLIVNEYESTSALTTEEYAVATSTEWKSRLVDRALKHGTFERFIMKVHKDFQVPI